MTVEPRIFFRLRANGVKIGPLGLFDVGEVIAIEGTEHIVTAVEPDGMAVAFRRDGAPEPQEFRSLSAVMRQLDAGGHLSYGRCQVDDRQLRQMAATIRGNRRRAGLAPIVTEDAA
jgi:hypothetical protein